MSDTSHTRDFYEERRRKWRRSAFWRGFLVAAAIAVVVGLWLGASAVAPGREQIARVAVNGVITDDRDRDEMLAAIADDDAVRAVVLRCLLYTSPSPRDGLLSRMPSSA